MRALCQAGALLRDRLYKVYVRQINKLLSLASIIMELTWTHPAPSTVPTLLYTIFWLKLTFSSPFPRSTKLSTSRFLEVSTTVVTETLLAVTDPSVELSRYAVWVRNCPFFSGLEDIVSWMLPEMNLCKFLCRLSACTGSWEVVIPVWIDRSLWIGTLPQDSKRNVMRFVIRYKRYERCDVDLWPV